MDIQDLLRSQKNAILRLIEDRGFDPTDFSWAGLEGLGGFYEQVYIPRLIHNPTGYEAVFDISTTPWRLSRSPGAQTTSETIECKTWNQMYVEVDRWLVYLKRESEQPDLWELVEARQRLVKEATATDAPNDTFTEAEQEAIASKLDEIKDHIIATYRLEQPQLKLLEDQFEFLKTESKKQGRRSWVQMALGVVLSMYLAKIDPAVVQYTLRMIVDTLMPYITKLLEAGS